MVDSNLSPSNTEPGRSPWLDWIAADRKRIATILYAVAAVLAIVAVAIHLRYPGEWWPIALWCASLATVAALAAIVYPLWRPETFSDLDLARFLVLAIGGLTGLMTTLFLGIGLSIKWWSTLTGGWQAWQGDNSWHVWVIIGAVFGGLALMLVSLQTVSGSVREQPILRRLVYGYNAVLTGLLLLAILGLLNGLAYTPWGPFKYLSQTYPWTQSSIYGLSSRSENILRGLTKPTKVYVLLPARAALHHQIKALFDNTTNVTDKVEVEFIDPDRDLDRMTQLESEFKVGERYGVLIVTGTPPNVQTRFVNPDELEEPPDMMARNRPRAFRGEAAIITEIHFLAEGKEKPVLYFTQGNGEFDLADTGRSRSNLDRGLADLKRALEANNFHVKGLRLAATTAAAPGTPDAVTSPSVPADATMVLCIAPTEPFNDDALKSLQEYMTPTDPTKTKGKLIVMLEPALTPDRSKLVMTGLEKFVAPFNVEVGQNRVLKLRQFVGARNHTQILAQPNPDESFRKSNPAAAAFSRTVFPLFDVRTVQPSAGDRPPDSKFRAEALLVAPPGQEVWAETDVTTAPSILITDLHAKGELQSKFSKQPLSLAVVVSETSPGTGAGPHAFMQQEQKPRLIVFGDASMVCNTVISSEGIPFFDFYRSCLEWLRERPSSIGIQAQEQRISV